MLLGFMTALHVFSPTLGGMFPFPELEQKSLFDLQMECEMSLPPSNIVVNKVAITIRKRTSTQNSPCLHRHSITHSSTKSTRSSSSRDCLLLLYINALALCQRSTHRRRQSNYLLLILGEQRPQIHVHNKVSPLASPSEMLLRNLLEVRRMVP